MFTRPSAVSFVASACSLAFLGCGGNPSRSPEGPATPPPAGQEPTAVSQPAAAKDTTAKAEPATAAGAALADSARALAGSWRCSGSVYGPNGASPSEVTLEVKLELDKAWLQTEFAVSSGEYKYKFTSHRTFDNASRKWMNVIVDNLGGHTLSSSKDGVIWTGESSGPMGAMKIRDTETIVSPGKVKMLGQYSPDGSGWSTGYELSCSRR